jgi:hypothetical protein
MRKSTRTKPFDAYTNAAIYEHCCIYPRNVAWIQLNFVIDYSEIETLKIKVVEKYRLRSSRFVYCFA